MTAQQTTDAFFRIAMRRAAVFIPLHRLMTAVIAGDIATSAADAFLLINPRIDDIAAIEVFRRDNIAIRQPDHLL
ncbi:Uncharacterised protein [Salmonella enterica subsp. enterica serovar Bovismorbificans]|uniref:Uncharacterized protein n=1 Tax=Salmonella enterica subsp. enterica serovar Bovismorbificans TaxID=58097 RepID=A0A655C3Q8_SALET|nr:Uncharacterised protein [Salmonella enterica subsp. enterica serovar Bovismorbificans]CNT94552.1 Uncharacterised protein [Salmonella enterica subsp. enterica serovar Bovismorbificans]